MTAPCVAELSAEALGDRPEGAVIDGKANAWLVVQEKCIRAMTALSMRLRLSHLLFP
jgi:hypothetical protein